MLAASRKFANLVELLYTREQNYKKIIVCCLATLISLDCA